MSNAEAMTSASLALEMLLAARVSAEPAQEGLLLPQSVWRPDTSILGDFRVLLVLGNAFRFGFGSSGASHGARPRGGGVVPALLSSDPEDFVAARLRDDLAETARGCVGLPLEHCIATVPSKDEKVA